MALVESFSGIRGIYNQEFDKQTILKYAQIYLDSLNKHNPTIVIGIDTRPSSLSIFNLLTENLNCKIINVGIAPTPLIENAVRLFNADGGIIITASHNEPEFNGFKFLDIDGSVLEPAKIEKIIRNFHTLKEFECGTKADIIEKGREAIDNYKDFLKNTVKEDNLGTYFKMLVDPNGGSGFVSKEIFEEFGVNASYINMEVGKFARLIEPNQKSLYYLKEKIKDSGVDFALGFDCDADRVEILLKDGRIVSGNEILGLIAKEILSKTNRSDKIIVVNDATSYMVKEIAQKHGGFWKEVEVGEINVVTEMNNSKALIGGEGSNGGVIIPESKCRDGILTVLFILKILKNSQKSLEELIESLPKYFYLKDKILMDGDFKLLRGIIKKHYLKNNFDIFETGNETGGLKAFKEGSWIWFRQSKTEEGVLRVISDSKDRIFAEQLLEDAKDLIKILKEQFY